MTSSGNRLVALHVGADRTLRVGPDVAAGGTVIRAVPVGRLVVALGEPGFGATAALLDPADKLRTLDTVTLK
jgi:hypothetical protein